MKLFGTDGIRGLANQNPVTPEIAMRLGWAMAREFFVRRDGPPVLVARDTRLSGPMLESAVAAGVASAGGNVRLGGVLPTPAVAALSRRLPCAAAVMISASHNPYEDNGLKVFGAGGLKCDDAAEARIAQLILSADELGVRPTGAAIGRMDPWPEAEGEWVRLASLEFSEGLSLNGMRIVVDAAHGAAFRTTPAVLRNLGAEVIEHFCSPDGVNINRRCGSTYPEVIAGLIRQTEGAHLGIAHDGDADRVAFADETGDVLDGDEVLAILGRALHQKGRLAKGKLVATVMSNLGLDEAMREAGISVVRAQVGDRYVLERMLAEDLNLGGEQSGHVILRDYNSTGDGLNTALQILRVMRETGQPLSQLRRCLRKYPQLLINEPVAEKRPFEQIEGLVEILKQAETELGSTGRILLRYSGTENKVRLLLEAREKSQLNLIASRILAPFRSALV
jgi:phosphoglucosamine mutase